MARRRKLKVGTTHLPLTGIVADIIELKTSKNFRDYGVNALAFGCSGAGCNYSSVMSLNVDLTGKQLRCRVMVRAYRYTDHAALSSSTREIMVGFSNRAAGSGSRKYIIDHGDIYY